MFLQTPLQYLTPKFIDDCPALISPYFKKLINQNSKYDLHQYNNEE
jgi:hypothetical protein